MKILAIVSLLFISACVSRTATHSTVNGMCRSAGEALTSPAGRFNIYCSKTANRIYEAIKR